MKTYLWTLDSHDCFGPFDSKSCAAEWARLTAKSSYQLLDKPPFAAVAPIKPAIAPVTAS